MHIQNSRHRLFIAAPIFAVCVTWSMIDGLRQSAQVPVVDVPGTVFQAEEGERIVQITGGIVLLAPHSTFRIMEHGPELVRGSVLVVADGRLALRLGDVTVSGWAGGFHVTVQGNRISIAALTTPVRIDRTGETMIVPVRTQMPSLLQATIVPVPQHFLREHVPAIAMLKDRLPLSPPSPKITPPLAAITALQLPAARERADRAAGRGVDCGLQLAGAAAQGQADALLQPCLERADDWLLLSFHLAVRNAVWTLPAPASATVEERLQRVALLPISDRGSTAVPEPIVSWWAEEVPELFADASDTLLSERFPPLADSLVQLSRDGYPDRAKRYATYLLRLHDAGTIHAGAAAVTLRSVLFDAVPRFTIPAPVAPSAESDPVDPAQESMDPAVLLAQADAVLRDAGFMSTGKTHLEPEGASVSVQNIVFGTLNGYQILRFSFDPVTTIVSRIEVDGKVFPYHLPFDRFVAWLRGEEMDE